MGPTGPFSQALANKILVTQTPDASGGVINLQWSTSDLSNVYVPYAVGTTTTTLAPIDPSGTGTGWRFSKTYPVPSIATGVNPLVSGSSYTIVALGNAVLNWTLMGASAATIGTTFTYNGTTPTGGLTTAGTAAPNPVLLIDSSTNPLTVNSSYIITFLGSPAVNWVAMGASSPATVNTLFIYNGTTPVNGGTTAGSAVFYPTTKISWYTLNALYGLGLPQTSIPSIAIKKKNLRNAWFLIKMNSDVAQQGNIAIQIETYAYNFSGNTTNDYTGRWAYSFPLQQGQGFAASSTTNITNTAGLLIPRLRSGFTYLLYAGDISPAIIPNNGLTFAQGGSTLFAPSQVSTENTLRDPFELYTTYPHLGLTSSSYVANTTAGQPPTYGGANPYTDQADVEVASIYLNTSSTAPPSGAGQGTLDFNVMAFGYSGLVESTGTVQTFSYTTSWV